MAESHSPSTPVNQSTVTPGSLSPLIDMAQAEKIQRSVNRTRKGRTVSVAVEESMETTASSSKRRRDDSDNESPQNSEPAKKMDYSGAVRKSPKAKKSLDASLVVSSPPTPPPYPQENQDAVIFTAVDKNNPLERALNPIVIMKAMEKAGCSEFQKKFLRKGDLLIRPKYPKQTIDRLLNMTKIGNYEVRASRPKHNHISKAVAYQILGLSKEQIITEINYRNPSISKCIDAKPMGGRGAYVLSFNGPPPHQIGFCEEQKILHEYKWQGAARCNKCQSFKHATNKCNSTLKCPRCSGPHTVTACIIENVHDPATKKYLKCPNCQGPHSSGWKGCVHYQNQVKVNVCAKVSGLPRNSAAQLIAAGRVEPPGRPQMPYKHDGSKPYAVRTIQEVQANNNLKMAQSVIAASTSTTVTSVAPVPPTPTPTPSIDKVMSGDRYQTIKFAALLWAVMEKINEVTDKNSEDIHPVAAADLILIPLNQFLSGITITAEELVTAKQSLAENV